METHIGDVVWGQYAEDIILRAREVAKLPVPHAGTLASDGSGYEGFDSFSDVEF